MSRRRRARALPSLAVGVCLLATACGTQVDDAVRQQASRAALSAPGSGVAAGSAGPETTVDPATGELIDPA
ncbi:MAG: hypothetical protein JWN08_262, partial [Frankiales bacterium]|nr:hypothetical protein [Frankiales bacterium]